MKNSKNSIRSKTTYSLILLESFLTTLSTLAHPAELKTVPHVDIKRYMGNWNVIAYIPNFIERDCVSSIENYTLRDDGKIDNGFICKKRDGSKIQLSSLAWIENTQTNAEWRIQFNWDTFLGSIPIPIHFKYFILDLDEDHYSYTVVGHPSRNLLWIMARNRTLDEATYETLLKRAQKQGFDITRLIKIPVTHPEKPGLNLPV